MPSDHDLARVGLEAYHRATDGKTHDGRPIPTFDEIARTSPRVIAAWEAAARAIADAVRAAEAA